jgi:hypothetical protein
MNIKLFFTLQMCKQLSTFDNYQNIAQLSKKAKMNIVVVYVRIDIR